MEKDLFLPVKRLLEGLGYTCDGEVNGIDLYAEKDGTSTAVELKRTFDFRVLQQAALRQKAVDSVYIAVFRPKDLYSRAGRDKQYLLKRLGIGLIVVSERTREAQLVLEPVVTELSAFQKRGRAKRDALSAEFARRRLKANTGGVSGTKLITGYREDALLVLNALFSLGGEAAVKDIRAASGVGRATALLYGDPYGWFTHPKKGIYGISPAGTAALSEFADTIRLLTAGPQKE